MAFVDSIDEPVCLMGESDGAMLALHAATEAAAVVALEAIDFFESVPPREPV